MSRLLPVLALLLLTTAPALAQRSSFGIGGQVGDPTGLTIRAGALDLAAGWNLSNNSFSGQVHYLLADRALGGAPANFRFFYGPGVFVGVRDRPRDETETALGLSLNAGLSYFAGPIEIFGQVTPRLQLVDQTDFDLGAALGLRFYL